jgi:predicted metal-binding membrane protein
MHSRRDAGEANVKVISKQRANARRVTARRSRARLWVSLAALVLLAAAALAFAVTGSEPSGALTAQQTFHDFGMVSMNDGDLVARFPLTVEGAVKVIDVQTS